MKRPFLHTVDEYFDAGDLGEHEIDLTALVEEHTCGDGSSRFTVDIMIATVRFNWGSGDVPVSVLPALTHDSTLRTKYEDEILCAWKRAKDALMEEGA